MIQLQLRNALNSIIITDVGVKNRGRNTVYIQDLRTNHQFLSRWSSGGYSLGPGTACQTIYELETNTTRWEVELSVRRSTAIERASLKLQSAKWFPNALKSFASGALDSLPKECIWFRLESDPIEVVDGTNGLPRIYQLHSAPDTH